MENEDEDEAWEEGCDENPSLPQRTTIDDVLDEDEARLAAAHPLDDGSSDPDMVPGIETVEHVVEFYAKYGQDSPVKFFYCNRATVAVRFRPYDLVVVARTKVGRSSSLPLCP